MLERHARSAANAAHRRCSDWVEQRIMCAYVELAAAQDHADNLPGQSHSSGVAASNSV